MTADELEELGVALAKHRKAGALAEVSLEAISSLEEAELVQAFAVEAFGGSPIGYSVRATSSLTRRLLGCDEPIFGEDIGQSDAPFRIPHGLLGAGCVLSFVFGRPYPVEGEVISRETAVQAISTCRPAIEILGRRVSGAGPLNAWTATADFGLNVLLIKGNQIANWKDADLAAAQATARINDQALAIGSGNDLSGHPLETVIWLARALGKRGSVIEAGEIVTSGSFTGMAQVLSGQRFEADFGELGHVEASFS